LECFPAGSKFLLQAFNHGSPGLLGFLPPRPIAPMLLPGRAELLLEIAHPPVELI
jgi:hypothetical protein